MYNLGTTTPSLGLISEIRNVDESTVSPVDGPKVVVEKVEPAKVPTSTTAPPLGLISETTNVDKSTVSTVDAPPLGLISEPRKVDESTVSTVDAPKIVVAQVKPAKIATSTTAPPLGLSSETTIVDASAVDAPKVLVENENERQRLALASFFNTPKNVKATSKPRNRKHKQNEVKTASKLSFKNKSQA